MIQEKDRNQHYVRKVSEDTEHGVAVIEIKNKSENGLPDPEPTQIEITVAKLALLPSLEDPTIVPTSEREETYAYVFLQILGQEVAFLQKVTYEGGFAGTEVEYTDQKVVRSQVSQGDVEARYIDERIAVFAKRDFMTGNVRAENEEILTLTPESILSLPTLSEHERKTREASTEDIYFYHVYEVFGSKIAFEESRYVEDLAHGRAVDINGPYLVRD